MKKDKVSPPHRSDLRQQAEERLAREKSQPNLPFSQEDAKRLLHELQVHQVELDMQNEELRQARQELEVSLKRYSDLYDFAPLGYFTLDSAGVIREANLSGAAFLGVERSRLLGRRFDHYLPPESHSTFNGLIRQARAGGAQPACEVELSRGAEAPRYLSINGVAEGSEPGQDWRLHLAVQDITERRWAEGLNNVRLSLLQFAATHSLPELLQKTLDEVGALTGSPIGFYHFVDADQKHLSLQAWSTQTLKEFCRAEGKGLHYSIDQAGVWVDCLRRKQPVIHNDYASLPHRRGMPPGHATVVRELVVPIMRNGRVAAILGIGNKAGEYSDRDVEKVTFLADIAWEIAEHKLAEEELRASEKRFRTLFEQVAVGVAQVSTADGRFIKINQKYCDIVGYTQEEMLARDFQSITHPEDLRADLDNVQRLMKGELDEFSREKRYIRKDGSQVWVKLSVSPLWQKGQPREFNIAVVEDITESVRDRQALAAKAIKDATLAELAKALMSLVSPIEIAAMVYAAAKQLTDSPIAFVGHMDRLSGHLVRFSPPLGLLANCQVQDQPMVFAKFKGLWGWVLNHRQPLVSNDPAGDPRASGLPPGHVPLQRFLAAPALVGDALLGLVAVANAPRDYGEEALATIQHLALLLALALDRHGHEQDLVSHQEKLRSLAMQLSAAEESERLRIASDLHDSVGQNLGMASQRLKMLRADQPPPPETLVQVITLVDQAIASTRHLTAELSPPVLYQLGLGPALEWLAETQQARHGVRMAFQDDGQPKPLSQQESTFLFRAAVELVANALKHAQARRIDISLDRQGRALELAVVDDGGGFDYHVDYVLKSEGFGLFSINERIRSLGGSLEVDSRAGRGTQAKLRLPLGKRRQAKAKAS